MERNVTILWRESDAEYIDRLLAIIDEQAKEIATLEEANVYLKDELRTDLIDQRDQLLIGNARLREALSKLVAELPDYALEEARKLWGNTNVAVVKHWRDNARAALRSEPGQ